MNHLPMGLRVSRPGACGEALVWIRQALEYEAPHRRDAARLLRRLDSLTPAESVGAAVRHWGGTATVSGETLEVTAAKDGLGVNTIVTALVKFADEGSWWTADAAGLYRGIVDSSAPGRCRMVATQAEKAADPFELE
jgi:hypothetical protein